MTSIALLSLLLSLQAAESWPHWRGPSADGVAAKADPPVEWSETKNIRWKVEIPGSGSATPIVWGDKLFVLTAVDTGKKGAGAVGAPPPSDSHGMSTSAPTTIHRFDVICLDRMSGKTLWTKTAVEAVPHEGHHTSHGF